MRSSPAVARASFIALPPTDRLIEAYETPARNAGLDALRAATTLLVVFHHTAITYGAVGGWFWRRSGLEWPNDAHSSRRVERLFAEVQNSFKLYNKTYLSRDLQWTLLPTLQHARTSLARWTAFATTMRL